MRHGVVHAGVEDCDDGNQVDDDACTNACQVAVCGDGIVQAGEECDDANAVNIDECTNVYVTRCGDGILRALRCDDANNIDDDICTMPVRTHVRRWHRSADEACDDGNDVDDDACSNAST